MKFVSIILIHFLLSISIVNCQVNSIPPRKNDLGMLKKELSAHAALLQLPGMAIAVVKDGKIIYQQIEGYANLEKKIPMRADHMFQIASVTKTFTSNLMMQYEQEKIASLEDFALNYRFINIWFGWPYNVNANTKLKHFLSHTSEDGPGNSFVYNGQRFNYIYGLFEAAGGYMPDTDAYSLELQKRIFAPLHMTHTIPGFPDSKNDPLFSRIATPYLYDTINHSFREDTVNYRWTKAYPATGIMSTLGDLARYTTSYDKNELITAANYTKITTPQVLNDGSKSPYGIGWFTEEFEGTKMHWHYGHADSFAALLVRVPETGYTFILLANSNAPSDALRLGDGNICQSPFVTTFLKYFNNKRQRATINWAKYAGNPEEAGKVNPENLALFSEELVGQALFRYYAEKMFKTHTGEAEHLIKKLFNINPSRFDRYDTGLIYLLTSLNSKQLEVPLARLISAYEKYGHIQPYVLSDIAHYYERIANAGRAFHFYQILADSKGFETRDQTVEACRKTGKYLITQGRAEEGRTYYWKAINDLKMLGADDKIILEVIKEMNTSGN